MVRVHALQQNRGKLSKQQGVILLDAGDKYSVPSKTRTLFQVRKWAGVLGLAGSVLASPAGNSDVVVLVSF